MKKIVLAIIILTGIGIFLACQKDEKNPKLNAGETVIPVFTSPTVGSSFILLKDNADSVLTTFAWSATQYNLPDLATTKYTLQLDIADSNFSHPINLTNTTGTSYTMKVGAMNTVLLNLGVVAEQSVDIALRVLSYINTDSDYANVYSEPVVITVTTYSGIVYIKPIYLLGDATDIDWDNTKGYPMQHLGNGVFARVETLDPAGDWFKFISILGAWAPQWGTDATGTSESGPLVYRPDEATPDPPSMPSPAELGPYYIEADTLGLTYRTYLTSGELFLVGDATSAGWNNAAGLPFTEDPDSAHLFTIVTDLNASGGMKFLEVSGQWAPQWGTNSSGNSIKGQLVYRPSESIPDPANIPAPSSSGTYMITVDLRNISYKITPQ